MEQGMLNNGQRQQLEGIAALGRNEDTYLAHVAPDEMVVPAQALRDNPLLKQAIEKVISKYGIDPNQFVVGNGSMDLNPLTGLPEFGFLSKVWKKVKKVVKKVAPVAALIPGVGTALGGVLGGIGGLATKIPGIGGALGKLGTSAMSGIAKLGIPGISSIAGGTAGGFGGIGSALTTKAGLFGGGPLAGIMGVGGPAPVTVQPGDNLTKIAQKAGVSVQDLIAANPQIANPNLIQAGMKINIPGGGGGFLSNILGPGQGSVADYDPATGAGQSGIGLIEDLIKGTGKKIFPDGVSPSQGGGGIGGLFGGNMGAAALAGLLGKTAYDSAKERMGGIAETPKVTMDQLGRYQMAQNLGTGGSRADFGLAPAPVALQFSNGDVVNMEDYINKMTNELIEAYKKDKKYKESRLLPASYIMDEKQEASLEAAKRNDPATAIKPSFQLMKGVIKILTGESGDRIPQRKVDEIKNMVRSSVKEKQMAQMGFNMGGIAELDMREGGESAGPGTGTSDDIPAMLSDGEFVMTAKATRGAGAFDVNKTKSGIELIKGGSASREKGVKNMRELMNIFEAI